MFFITRVGDSFEQAVLVEGSGPKAPSITDKPPCWHYNFHANTRGLREAFRDAVYSDIIFESIHMDTAIGLYCSGMSDSFGWRAEFTRDGFETREAVWEYLRTRWCEGQLAQLSNVQSYYEKKLAHAQKQQDAAEEKKCRDLLNDITLHRKKLLTT